MSKNSVLNPNPYYDGSMSLSRSLFPSIFFSYVVEDGYEFFADRQLVTVFSAPNYCGEFDNAGAMMSVDDSLMCSFQILKPAEKKLKFNSGISLFGSTTTAKPGNTPNGIKFLGGRT